MLRELVQQISQCFQWVILIAPWEQALRVRAGKHVRRLNSGIYLRIPFIDRVYRQSVRRRLTVLRPLTVTTIDGHCVTLLGSIGYSIVDLEKLYETLHDAEDTIEAEVAAAVARFIGLHPLQECRASAIEQYIRELIDLTRYGLGGQEFYVTNFAVVRTYRLITGELAAWSHGSGLETSAHDQAPTPML